MSSRRFSNVDESLFGERTKSISQLNKARKGSKAAATKAAAAWFVFDSTEESRVLLLFLRLRAHITFF